VADAAEERIAGLLTARGVRFRVHEHPVSRTVEDAKAQLPFPLDQLLKTIAFRVKNGPWLLVACKGQDRVDYRKLADAAGVRRADIVQPAPDEVEAALGYVIGGVAPFPPNAETRTIVDAGAAATMGTVYCGIGRNDRTLEIAIADLIAVSGALVAPVVQGAPSVA
jgi:Cys-tRNA(Pro)/Cys-tRNA(Cys) deacylase